MFDNPIIKTKVIKNINKKNESIDNIKNNIIKEIDIKEPKKTEIKEEQMEEEEEIKEQKNETNENAFKIDSENEKELIKVELGKNIVARILLIDDEKYIDFGKFYKGYPTKKNIRIKYNTYLKLNQLLNK